MKRKTRAELSSKEPNRKNRWTVDDDQQTRFEAELVASGRHDAVPREGLIGAHTARREVGEPMDEPIAAAGADVGPTERAAMRERERHRLQRELGVVPAGEAGNVRQHRGPGVARAALDAAGRQADLWVK
jgi:hypothetical protein